MPNLELAALEDIMVELTHRYQALVFSCVNHDDEISLYLHGSQLLCSGLVSNAQHEILRASLSGEHDSNP